MIKCEKRKEKRNVCVSVGRLLGAGEEGNKNEKERERWGQYGKQALVLAQA